MISALKNFNLINKFSCLKNRIFSSARYVKEEIQTLKKPEPVKEKVSEFNQSEIFMHGVIIKRNFSGEINYSLDSSKIMPLKYGLNLHEQKPRSHHIKNLTNELKRVCYNGYEFETLFDEQPHLSRVVGSLPQKWGRKIGNSPEKREKVDNLFSEFAREFHANVKDKYSKYEIKTDALKQGLSEILSTDINIEPLGAGSWARTYLINADSQNYVLKVFYNQPPQSYCDTNLHYFGNYHELSSAVWASKHDADSYAMFYMGRFGEKEDGYMLTRYLPNRADNQKIYNGKPEYSDDNFVFSSYLHRLYCADTNNDGNIINKKICDYGDTWVSSAAKMDEKTFKLARNIGRFLDENNSKALSETITMYKGSQELEKAKSFLQYLIDNFTTVKNYKILNEKKDMLAQLGLDYVPDIRFILSHMIFPTDSMSATTARMVEYSKILGIPERAFQSLWYKYPDVRKQHPSLYI